MRQRKRRRSEEDEEINLTPLLDVVFVILIMFIVVAPLLETDKVQLASSHPEVEKSVITIQEKHPITIYVKGDNSVWMNKQLVSFQVLEELLSQAKNDHIGTKPLVFHDKRASFGTYQSVKNAVEAAGFEEMEILLQPG